MGNFEVHIERKGEFKILVFFFLYKQWKIRTFDERVGVIEGGIELCCLCDKPHIWPFELRSRSWNVEVWWWVNLARIENFGIWKFGEGQI